VGYAIGIPDASSVAINCLWGLIAIDFHVSPNPKKIIQLDASGKQGRYVRIQLLDKDYLSLAEVQVMGVEPTGNGRRESYAHIPMPRMTNTYMLNGEDTLEQMIASVDDGPHIYYELLQTLNSITLAYHPPSIHQF
jgi:hypothetical protein